MTKSLFRKEATDAQGQRLFGEVTIAQPLSFAVMSSFLLAILLTAAGFVVTGTYARKETVIGFLQPDKGIVRVFSPASGVVTEVLVDEGQSVEAGQMLARIQTERRAASGVSVRATMLDTIEAQLTEVENRIQLQKRRAKAERERLEAQLVSLREEREQLADQIEIQEELVQVAINNLKAIENLTEDGVISETEYKAREEQVLGYRQELSALKQRKAANADQIRQTELELEQLPIEGEDRLSELASTRASLERQKAELAGQRAFTVTAPVSGRVTALRAVNGGRAGNEPLLAILPEGGVLEAHLFVPSRAIGFVEPGQEVKLAYDAFDHRRFGVYDGTVRDVSATVLPPGDVAGPISVEQPVYRVTVALENQSVRAYGKTVPLQAGMTLTADIIMERRSLGDWLLDPLRSLQGQV